MVKRGHEVDLEYSKKNILDKMNSFFGHSVVEKLKSLNINQAEIFPKDHRPWGWFESLIKADSYQVKLLYIQAGEMLSMQSHKYRSEHWVVISGTATVQTDKKQITLRQNESTFIGVEQLHRLSNHTKEPLFVIEVQTGKYLEEDDIFRYDDKYHRT